MRIRIIDLESTGETPPEHGVCEIGWCDLVQHQDGLLTSPYWRVGSPHSQLVHPGRSIPPETSAIHHLIDSDVAGMPTFDHAARMVLSPLANRHDGELMAYAAHSIKAERQFITPEMDGGLPWICTYKCALRLFPDAPSHSNQALRYYIAPVDMIRHLAMPAHRAGPDAYATAFLLREMLKKASVDDLINWSSQPALQVWCRIGGSFRNHRWTDVDWSFLEWVAARDFDEDVLFTVRHEMDRREEEERKAQAARTAESIEAAQ